MVSRLWRTRWYGMLTLLALLGLLLAACTPAEGPAEEAPAGDAGSEGAGSEDVAEPPADAGSAERKVATFIFTQEFDTLNPAYTNMWFSSITQQIWNAAAWDFDVDNNPRPVLVTDIPTLENGGISADGTVLTLNLRDNIVWSDGAPITSADFQFTWEMITNPANTVASTYPYDLITSLETPDERTVVVGFDEPFVPWTATLFTFVLPQHVLGPVFEAEGTIDNAAWNLAPTVGAGPFVFSEWESGSFARFVRNDNYYGEPARLDEIFIRFVPDDASQVAALQTGDGDLGTFIAYSDIPTLQEANVDVVTAFSGYNEGWFFYLGEDGHPALQDPNVRQAIAMGFDRFALNQDLLLGLTQPAATFWDNTPYADPGVEAWPYDPDQARALLDAAGWVDTNGDGIRDKDGVELVLVHGTTNREIRQDTQAVAQQQLAEIGVGLELQSYAADVYFASYSEGGPCGNGQLDICEHSTSPSFPDPNTSQFMCREIPTDENPTGINDQKVCDPALDALFEAQAIQMDFNARQQTFYEISRKIYEDVYWLGVWQDPDIWAVNSRLENVKISGVTPFYNVAEWDIAP